MDTQTEKRTIGLGCMIAESGSFQYRNFLWRWELRSYKALPLHLYIYSDAMSYVTGIEINENHEIVDEKWFGRWSAQDSHWKSGLISAAWSRCLFLSQ